MSRQGKWFFAVSLALAAAAGFCTALLLQGVQIVAPLSTSANTRPGTIDIGFAQFMSVHHDQAVTLCQIVMGRGDNKVSGIANAIQMAQLLEMGQMQGWLLMWNKPLIPTSKRMDWLLSSNVRPNTALLRYIADCKAASGGMPGLASTEELNHLRELEGDARDLLFLQLMIRHHAGALPMAQFAAQYADTPLIRRTAALDYIEQSKELNNMQLLLKRDFVR